EVESEHVQRLQLLLSNGDRQKAQAGQRNRCAVHRAHRARSSAWPPNAMLEQTPCEASEPHRMDRVASAKNPCGQPRDARPAARRATSLPPARGLAGESVLSLG